MDSGLDGVLRITGTKNPEKPNFGSPIRKFAMDRCAAARRLSAAPKSTTYATFAEPEHTLLGVHHFERGAWLVHGYSFCEICARHTHPRCRTDISSSTV